MRHFSIWDWTDYVRGLETDADRSVMDTHLSAPCLPCQRTVNVLRGVAALAHDEAGYLPPRDAVQDAQAIASWHRPEKTGFPAWVARLVHDTFREPLPAGMRAEGRHSRHTLYEAGSYSLDLQVESQPPSGLVSLVGQLADRRTPATLPLHLPVWVMERKRLVTSTLCNRFGEFQLEYAPSRDLRLCIPVPEAKKCLTVSLNRLSPDGAGEHERAISPLLRRKRPGPTPSRPERRKK